jgi:hypothetical protein
MKLRTLLSWCAILALPLVTWGHVNSPDVYYDGNAGPYHLLVTVRPPAVVPGVAQIQIRTAANDVERISILPLKMVGAAAKLAPKADTAERSATDPQVFTGNLWIMERGSWKVQVRVEGTKGAAELAVPVPAVSVHSAKMQTPLGILLAFLGIALVAGMVGIIGAAGREASLDPGQTPSPNQTRRAYIRMAIATVCFVGILWAANSWWKAEASNNARLNYITPHAQLSLQGGNVLLVKLDNPNTVEHMFNATNLERVRRLNMVIPDVPRLDDLIPDHGHLMHLFLVSMPDMQSFWHLHPDPSGQGQFTANLPSLPAGHYQVYADIVHQTGFPETQIAEIDVPAVTGAPLQGDDSGGSALTGEAKVMNGSVLRLNGSDRAPLSDGYRMEWERDQQPLKANQATWFRFRVEDKNGKPAILEDYMGMAGHAAFISNDGKIFAHVHPAGSVSMAAVDLADGRSQSTQMAGMPGMNPPVNGEVSFPYGFPQAGDYHIFVQVKRAGRVETGVFFAHAEN